MLRLQILAAECRARLRIKDDFAKPKIVWADLARTGNAFIYDEAGLRSVSALWVISSVNIEFRPLPCKRFLKRLYAT